MVFRAQDAGFKFERRTIDLGLRQFSDNPRDLELRTPSKVADVPKGRFATLRCFQKVRDCVCNVSLSISVFVPVPTFGCVCVMCAGVCLFVCLRSFWFDDELPCRNQFAL